MMNELIEDESDPTKLKFVMSILDTSISENNVKVGSESLLKLAKSVKGMPLVAKLIEDDLDSSNDDFGGHEGEIAKDRDGNDYLKRNTIPIGSFTSEGYIEKREINGEEVEVLMGEGVLWVTRYPDIVKLMKSMFDNGTKINTSSEYRYYDSDIDEEGVEHHDGDMYFEGTAVLGSESNYVQPAYDSATFTMLNETQKKEFNLLVAQAIEKEDGGEKDMPKKKEKTQLNELSLYKIGDIARANIKKSLNDDDYVWVTDIYKDYMIVTIESNDEYGYYRYNYTVNENVINVDLESKQEVIENREWIILTEQEKQQMNELQEQLTQLNEKVLELTSTNSDLLIKLNEANEEKTQLNDTIKELIPFKEQIQINEKNAKIEEIKATFETKFNAVDGVEQFNSKEVQELMAQAIETGEVGLNAKLALNEKISELALGKLKSTPQTMVNATNSRDFTSLIDTSDEVLKDLM